jgi:hypothetical protein
MAEATHVPHVPATIPHRSATTAINAKNRIGTLPFHRLCWNKKLNESAPEQQTKTPNVCRSGRHLRIGKIGIAIGGRMKLPHYTTMLIKKS